MGQVIAYALIVGVVAGLLNGERFGFFRAFAVVGSALLGIGFIVRALDLGTDVLAGIVTLFFGAQIVLTIWSKRS